MKLVILAEHELDKDLNESIATLLANSFESYPEGKTYYNQLPSFRCLLVDAQKLIGHLAIDHRVINNGGEVVRIFGITDLCVDEHARKKGVGSKLLEAAETLAIAANVSFLISITSDPRLYKQNGFKSKKAKGRWTMIKQMRLFGIMDRNFSESLWVKTLDKSKWSNKYIDFLGPLF